eukprot:COSAG05_NODE_1652_length_4335_cov_49.472380_3_plen_63_part_00
MHISSLSWFVSPADICCRVCILGQVHELPTTSDLYSQLKSIAVDERVELGRQSFRYAIDATV